MVRILTIACIFVFAQFLARKRVKAGDAGLLARMFSSPSITALAVLICGLSLVEQYLRDSGRQPGKFADFFSIVPELVTWPAYYADSLGINRLDRNGPEWKQRNYVINSQGFRSKTEFLRGVIDSLRHCGNKIIAIIGDSNTEGCWASDVANSFPDLVDREDGICALNFGIGATDPKQYSLVARHFVPELLPDHVIVAICLQNDLMYYDRPATPGIPIWHNTNAGSFLSQVPAANGHPPLVLSSEEVYRFYLDNFSLFGSKETLVKTVVRQFVFTTMLYDFLFYRSYLIGIPDQANPEFSYRYLSGIKSLCDSFNIRSTFIAIPRSHDLKNGISVEEIKADTENWLRDLPVYYPDNFSYADYYVDPATGWDDMHLNDQGHAKFADLVLQLIRNQESAQ